MLNLVLGKVKSYEHCWEIGSSQSKSCCLSFVLFNQKTTSVVSFLVAVVDPTPVVIWVLALKKASSVLKFLKWIQSLKIKIVYSFKGYLLLKKPAGTWTLNLLLCIGCIPSEGLEWTEILSGFASWFQLRADKHATKK